MNPKKPTDDTDADQEPLSPAQEAAVAKVRRLMLVSSSTLIIGVAAVFGVIGYKVYRSGDNTAVAEAPRDLVQVVDTLPPGAKVVGTAVGEAQIVLTIELGGATELRTYDPDTLRPLGRLRLAPQP